MHGKGPNFSDQAMCHCASVWKIAVRYYEEVVRFGVEFYQVRLPIFLNWVPKRIFVVVRDFIKYTDVPGSLIQNPINAQALKSLPSLLQPISEEAALIADPCQLRCSCKGFVLGVRNRLASVFAIWLRMSYESWRGWATLYVPRGNVITFIMNQRFHKRENHYSPLEGNEKELTS